MAPVLIESYIRMPAKGWFGNKKPRVSWLQTVRPWFMPLFATNKRLLKSIPVNLCGQQSMHGGAMVKIKIINWNKFNPRTDVKRPSWFRLDNRLIEDPKFYDFTGDEFKILIYLFSMASRENSATFATIFGAMSRILNTTEKTIETTLKKLQQRHVVTFSTLRGRYAHGFDSHVDDTSSHATLHNKTLHNTTKHNTPEITQGVQGGTPSKSARFDFKSVALMYPNPRGRSEGIARLQKLITSQDEFERFSKAVKNYSEQTRLDGTEQKFIKHFSSFVGSPRSGHPWQDWIDHVPKSTGGKNLASNLLTDRVEDLDQKIFEDSI